MIETSLCNAEVAEVKREAAEFNAKADWFKLNANANHCETDAFKAKAFWVKIKANGNHAKAV